MKHLEKLTCVALLVCAAACGSGGGTTPAPTAAPGKKVDTATAGSISGQVKFEGPAPAPETIRVSTDKNCVAAAGPNPQSDAVLIAADGSIRNSFVWIKEGLDPGYSFDTPSGPVVLDQRGCVYAPRVVGVRAGQAIEIVNSDPTLHNVHALPVSNREFNYGQPKVGDKNSEVFTVPEVMVRFMCNVHGWMAAWVGVVPHPYFAVTDANGNFELKNVPPGTYTVEAWHEKFGRTTSKVTVADKQNQTAAFTFTPNSK